MKETVMLLIDTSHNKANPQATGHIGEQDRPQKASFRYITTVESVHLFRQLLVNLPYRRMSANNIVLKARLARSHVWD
jgi:hypothetical protein